MMSSVQPSIPSDPAEFKAFAASLRAENSVLKDEVYAKSLHIEKLKAELALLKRARYGRSSEKLDEKIEQLDLRVDDLEEAEAESRERRQSVSAPSAPRERSHPVRQALPAHLPREHVLHDAACVCPECGSKRLTRIGTDEREVLEYVPSHFKVIVHDRPKMACRDCEKVTQEPMPSLPIERGLPGPGLLAHVLISKYCDHLPVYRQSMIYARDGVELDRSTMAEWVGKMAFLLKPLAECIADHVRSGEVIHADD
jgi:transposase